MLLLACRVARVRALQAPISRGRLRPLSSTVAEPGTKVPVTLLSGFLGTGKTTLLRNLLEAASQDKDSKVGVVVNDMAAVNIDAKITARRLDLDESDSPKMQGAAEFVEIGDGCVCCSTKGELAAPLRFMWTGSAARSSQGASAARQSDPASSSSTLLVVVATGATTRTLTARRQFTNVFIYKYIL